MTRTKEQAFALANAEGARIQELVRAAMPADVGFVLALAIPHTNGETYLRYETNLTGRSAFEILAGGQDAILEADNADKLRDF
jgi:hypothetical protein